MPADYTAPRKLATTYVITDGRGGPSRGACRDEQAQAFYLRHGDFLQSPVDDLRLMVPMKTLRRYVD